jgi:hypothetical protein
MDEDFKGLINKCIVIYMDDLTIFSKDQSTHIADLRQVFNKCHKYNISLNPKKCLFGVTKGKLLVHIISEDRISIDPDRIEDILKLSPPHSLKKLMSFFGKINFVQKFISRFAKIVRPLNDLLKNGGKIECVSKIKKSFEAIKVAISMAPVLVSLDYGLPFKIYSFASEHSCVGILMQKKEKEDERFISFMSFPLKNSELNYSDLDKQSFSLIKVIKKFCHYILRSKVYAIVLDPTVKTLLMQNELGKRQGKWMEILQEFDLEIQPMKLVRGQGLSKMIADNQIEDVKKFRFDGKIDMEDQKKILVSKLILIRV